MDALASTKQELEKIMARGREMEEAAKLGQAQVEELLSGSTHYPAMEEKNEVDEPDERSIFVNNVHFSTTAYQLVQHFHRCGTINRVTILCNKYNGHPQGQAFIEFAEKEAANAARVYDGSIFKGREIKVMMKRTKQVDQTPSHVAIRRGRGNHRYGRGTRNPRYPSSRMLLATDGMSRTHPRPRN